MAKKKIPGNTNVHIKDKHVAGKDFYKYHVYQVEKTSKWWLLLLLTPLLTLIQCHKQIDAVCIDPDSDAPIEDIRVDMHYYAYMTRDAKGFAWVREIKRSETTDSEGVARFTKLPCSVFSYIFCSLSKAYFSARSECYEATDQSCNFHYTRRVKLDMEPRREDLYIAVVDRETGDLLPDASVVYVYTDGNEVVTDSTTTDAAGVAVLEDMRYCSIIGSVSASRYGYADTTVLSIPAHTLIAPTPGTVVPLRPIKENFTFFVRDKETRQPIAQALATVTLRHPNGSESTRQVHTSIDGKGIAVYEDAFILSDIAIHATKLHYKDGDLEGGPWRVDRFKTEPDSIRTVWLEAEPYVMNFVNVDSINGAPVANVRNHIRVTDPAGNVETYDEVSNRNGVFPVKAKEGSVIEIISDHAPGYKDKATRIPGFDGAEKIRMQPKMVTMTFRTLDYYTGAILPDCSLAVSGSISGHLAPASSGNGTFTVEARYVESLSIAASKQGYLTNDTSIDNDRVSELETAPQSERDIPLMLDLPPCEGGNNVPKGPNESYHKRSYAMGSMSGHTTIECDFYSIPDYLTVYDGVDTSGTPVVRRMKIANGQSIPVTFTKGAVTVVIESPLGNSSWTYVVMCPD